ncbi:hypothetical protein EDD18DRAFT_1246822 [Armillaria luteobubalina]|uniref:Transmembrane protein n=1 Tax=Armillaria luteobubalina TaxID=153913 RepID=A0AA39UX79_9AGAR|nr:hypothetical protein EDD18DRAFT_1246822 [Armillaria luteobubalina]
MAETLPTCLIPSNSDIAGIGVRVATYLQACLALFMAFSSVVYRAMRITSTMFEGDIEDDWSSIMERRAVQFPSALTAAIKSVESALFVTSISVIIGAMIQARSSEGLSSYHALVVLNLAQINSYTAFLLFLCRIGVNDISATVFSRQVLKIALRNYVLFAVHSCMMGAFGLWFWGNSNAFLRYASSNPGPCNPVAQYWIFTPVLSNNQALRIFFLIYYSVSAFPPFAFMVPMVVTAVILAAMYVAFLTPTFICTVLSAPVLLALHLSGHNAMKWLESKLESIFDKLFAMIERGSRVKWVMAVGGVVQLLPVNLPVVFYLYATEKMIRMNKAFLETPGEEAQWSYGQTLALVTALVTVVFFLRDVYKVVVELLRYKEVNEDDDGSFTLRRRRTI